MRKKRGSKLARPPISAWAEGNRVFSPGRDPNTLRRVLNANGPTYLILSPDMLEIRGERSIGRLRWEEIDSWFFTFYDAALCGTFSEPRSEVVAALNDYRDRVIGVQGSLDL